MPAFLTGVLIVNKFGLWPDSIMVTALDWRLEYR